MRKRLVRDSWCSLDAAPFLVEEDGAHVVQAGPGHLSGKLHGASRHDLHHEAAVVIFVFLLAGAAHKRALYLTRFAHKKLSTHRFAFRTVALSTTSVFRPLLRTMIKVARTGNEEAPKTHPRCTNCSKAMTQRKAFDHFIWRRSSKQLPC